MTLQARTLTFQSKAFPARKTILGCLLLWGQSESTVSNYSCFSKHPDLLLTCDNEKIMHVSIRHNNVTKPNNPSAELCASTLKYFIGAYVCRKASAICYCTERLPSPMRNGFYTSTNSVDQGFTKNDHTTLQAISLLVSFEILMRF